MTNCKEMVLKKFNGHKFRFHKRLNFLSLCWKSPHITVTLPTLPSYPQLGIMQIVIRIYISVKDGGDVNKLLKDNEVGTFLVAQWLRLYLPMQGDAGSIPGCGAKIPHTLQPKNRNIKQKRYHNKFNTDFKNGPNLLKKKMRMK